MSKIDTEHIKNMTNQIIGYENFKKEKQLKKMKVRKIMYGFIGAITLCMGTLSVDALTDNAISDVVKDIFTVKIGIFGGEEKTADCVKKEDGSILCAVDEDIIEVNENESYTLPNNEN